MPLVARLPVATGPIQVLKMVHLMQDLTVSTVGNVSTIAGWEIHNRRVELGQGGSVGPSTTTDRSGSVVSNLIGGYNTPEDPTPTLYSNATDDSAVPVKFWNT